MESCQLANSVFFRMLAALHALQGLLGHPSVTEMFKVIKNAKGACGGRNTRNYGGDNVRGKHGNENVKRYEEDNSRTRQEKHAICECLPKRNDGFLLLDTHAAHAVIIGDRSDGP